MFCQAHLKDGGTVTETGHHEHLRPDSPPEGFEGHLAVWAAIIARRGDEVLLVRAPSSADAWSLPARRMTAHEGPRDAAVRAVRETTGLDVTLDALFDVYPVGEPTGGLLIVYLGTIAGDAPLVSDGVALFPRRALPHNLIGDGHVQALHDWAAASYHVAVVQPDRFCPKCGTRLVVREVRGQELPACPACRFVVYRDPKVGAGILIEDDRGHVLLVRRRIDPGRGKWHIPSGFVDAGEHPQEAALREVREETGLDVTIDGLFGVYTYADDPRGEGIWLCYRGRVVGGQPKPADDVSEVAFFPPTELPHNIAFASTTAALADWQAENYLNSISL